MANQYLPGVIQVPSSLLITNITRAYPMVITFTIPSTGSNTYVANQVVLLRVPITYGMYQANGLMGTIISVSPTSMTLNLDSRGFDTFTTPSGVTVTQPASLAPAGSKNLQYDNTTNEVPFQSLNNIGN